MDIEKKLIKLIKKQKKLRAVSIIFLVISFPLVGFGVWFFNIPMAYSGGLFAVVGVICLTRSFLHPQYNALHKELDAYRRNPILRIAPTWGESEELDNQLRMLEAKFYSHGASLLENKVDANIMKSEYKDTIVRVLSDFENLHKNSYDELCMAYANMAYASQQLNAGSTNIQIKKELIFRCLLYNMKYGFQK